jgi:maltooligosyltrehalose trehalohydrolase
MARCDSRITRRMPIGAELQPGGGAHFRVWVPRRNRVELVLEGESKPLSLEADDDGYFEVFASGAVAGTRYGYRLDGDPKVYPDPASRWQPEGPHELSAIVDPCAFEWHDASWRGVELKGQVIYELHVGTFTPKGTWAAAARELRELADLGVTLVEVMPVNEFAGEFGWGYDGVDLFAPTRLYGTPDDFRRFVDEAHRIGLGVILDVVYNHFGPTGNYLGQFSEHYLSKRHHTDWGDAINYDDPHSGPVREFFISNAGYWIDEYHLDGLRLDAVHSIEDDSSDHILAALTRRVREAARGRKTLVFAENERQDAKLLRPVDQGGFGLDAGWNDDFHHVARVAMTGHNEGYYGDYQGTAQELISAVKWGHLYQGQWNLRQGRLRGTPALDLPAPQFVNFLQNHDQVGNSPQGRRAHRLTSPGRHRALTALWALAPGTPLLFQGQEFSASADFHYFADHEGELRELVRKGRRDSLGAFRWLAAEDAADAFADPCDRRTFEECKLDLSERIKHAEAYALHRDLLRLRREDPVFSAQRGDRIHGSVFGSEAFLLRYLGDAGVDRLLLVNLGRDLEWSPITDPLLVPPAGTEWRVLWSSESPRYGGAGTGSLNWPKWYIPGHAAIVLASTPSADTKL